MRSAIVCDFVRADKNASRFRCVSECELSAGGFIIIICQSER